MIATAAPGAEFRAEAVVDLDRAHGAWCLRFDAPECLAFELAPNVQRLAVEVDIGPDETDRLRHTQAGEGEQSDERAPLVVGRVDEPPEVGGGELPVWLRCYSRTLAAA